MTARQDAMRGLRPFVRDAPCRRSCPCCGGPTRWTMMGRPMMCDGCKRRCEYIPADEPCANQGGCMALIDQTGPDDGPKCGRPKVSLHWCQSHTDEASGKQAESGGQAR